MLWCCIQVFSNCLVGVGVVVVVVLKDVAVGMEVRFLLIMVLMIFKESALDPFFHRVAMSVCLSLFM